MNSQNTVDMLRGIADHIARHELPSLTRLACGDDHLTLQAVGSRLDGANLALFLQWADTFGTGIEITAELVDGMYHMHANGTVGGKFPVKFVVLVNDDAGCNALAEEIGDQTGAVRLTRTQLAKIADPEPADDRAAVTA